MFSAHYPTGRPNGDTSYRLKIFLYALHKPKKLIVCYSCYDNLQPDVQWAITLKDSWFIIRSNRRRILNRYNRDFLIGHIIHAARKLTALIKRRWHCSLAIRTTSAMIWTLIRGQKKQKCVNKEPCRIKRDVGNKYYECFLNRKEKSFRQI